MNVWAQTAIFAAKLNGDTVREQQKEIRRLRKALAQIGSGLVAREFGLRAVFEYERIAREALSK